MVNRKISYSFGIQQRWGTQLCSLSICINSVFKAENNELAPMRCIFITHCLVGQLMQKKYQRFEKLDYNNNSRKQRIKSVAWGVQG